MTANTIILILIVLAAYIYLHFRLLHFIQPLRLRLAEAGEQFLARPEPRKPFKENVEFMLDNAFNPWFTIFTVVTLPFVALTMLVRRDLRERRVSAWQSAGRSIRSEFRDIRRMFMASIFAANPVFGVLCVIEMAVISALISAFGGTIRGAELVLVALVAKNRSPERRTLPT